MIVIQEQIRREARLTQLGIPSHILGEAVLAGEIERIACTELDPISASGYEAWRWAVRKLGELLIPQDWRKIDDKGLPLIIDPVGRIAIAVANGNAGTAVPELHQ